MTELVTFNTSIFQNLKFGRFVKKLTRRFPGKRTIVALYRDFLVQCGVWPALRGRNVSFEKDTGLNIEDPNDVLKLNSMLKRYNQGVVR